MSGWYEKFNDFLSLLKVVGPLIGLGGTGSTILLGGDRVFEGFAAHHGLAGMDVSKFDSDIIQRWGLDIMNSPVVDLSGSPVAAAICFVVFVVGAYLALHHLFSRKKRKEERISFYQRHHCRITLLIYMVLLVTIMVPSNKAVFFFALIGFVLFFSAHLYFHSGVIKQGEPEERVVYVIPLALMTLVLMFLPSLYGNNYFNPQVWHPDIEKDSGTVWTNSPSGVVEVFFADPLSATQYTVGRLVHNQGDGKWYLSLSAQERGQQEEFDALFGGDQVRPYQAVPMTTLLNMQVRSRLRGAQDIDASAEQARISGQIRDQEQRDVENGYPNLW